MANTISGFYQTVVAAATEASQLLAPTWKLHDSIFWDYRPEPATIGQTINVPIPTDPTSGVTDPGVGDVTVTDIAFSTQPIIFNKHPYYGYVIRDFEQFNSVPLLRRVFLDAALKGVKNNINAAIAALFVPANFTTNTAIATTAHVITVAQFLTGMAKLASQNVPVAADPANMALVLHPDVYTAMLDAGSSNAGVSAWTQAQIAGSTTVEHVRARGEMPTAYGMTMKLDQQMPATPGTTYTGAYFHRWAVAGVVRPLPPPDTKVVDYTYINFGPNDAYGGVYGGDEGTTFPIRVTVGYNQFPKQGYIVTIDAGYGLKVVRENMGQLFTTAY
jgi:hypothetical protein